MASSLGQIGTGNETAISALVKLLETTTDEFTCIQAARSLDQIDPGNETAISALVNLLEPTKDKNTRRQALETLGQIATGNEMVIKNLIKLLNSTYSLGPITETIEKIAYPGNSTAIEGLRELLRRSSLAYTRQQVKNLLQNRPSPVRRTGTG